MCRGERGEGVRYILLSALFFRLDFVESGRSCVRRGAEEIFRGAQESGTSQGRGRGRGRKRRGVREGERWKGMYEECMNSDGGRNV